MRGITMERRGIVFKFEGEVEEISVETFTQAVLGYSKLIQESARQTDDGLIVDVNISATRPGCIEAILSAVVSDLPGVLASLSQVSGQLADIVNATNAYLKLRKFLGEHGSPSKIERQGEQSVVITQSGGTMTVNNVVLKIDSSEDAVKAATAVFASLQDNESVRGLSIAALDPADVDVETFEASRDEFETIASAPRCVVDGDRVETEEHQILAVSRPVLEAEDRRKWQFFWNGIKISGTVVDKGMFEKLASHEWTFGIGDSLDCDLEITKRLNTIGAWENVRYRVVKVHNVISGPRESHLF